MPKNITEKHVEKILISAINASEDGYTLYKPTSFFDSVKGFSEAEILLILQTLDSRGALVMHRADFPESRNIHYIEFTGKSYDYVIRCNEARKQWQRNWRWNIIAALISTGFGAVIGAALARLSLSIWP